jgi:hypothetical protein
MPRTLQINSRRNSQAESNRPLSVSPFDTLRARRHGVKLDARPLHPERGERCRALSLSKGETERGLLDL